jgi:hypothetical protein
MDELSVIRKTLWRAKDCNVEGWAESLDALTNLESRALLGEPEIVERIRERSSPGTEGRGGWGYNLMDIECGALIGQYAYRYSEDIRKERDYWKKLAMDFHDAVHAEAEKRKGCEI